MGKNFQYILPVIAGERLLGARAGVPAPASERFRRQTPIGISHLGSFPLAMLTHRSAGNDKLENASMGGLQQ
jgi:hypothetical protein